MSKTEGKAHGLFQNGTTGNRHPWHTFERGGASGEVRPAWHICGALTTGFGHVLPATAQRQSFRWSGISVKHPVPTKRQPVEHRMLVWQRCRASKISTSSKRSGLTPQIKLLKNPQVKREIADISHEIQGCI
jgi:hypothetical protein